MPENQTDFAFTEEPSLQPGPVPHLRDEIARIWSLPLGENVDITLLRGSCTALRGRLQLECTPALPFDRHQPLMLSISGVLFSSRDIEHWKLLTAIGARTFLAGNPCHGGQIEPVILGQPRRFGKWNHRPTSTARSLI